MGCEHDPIVTALCTRRVQIAWEEREKSADRDGVNTADEAAMENYRRRNPLPLPGAYGSRDDFRETVRRAVYGDGTTERPVCHRPVKRKLTGALHEETLLGPVLDRDGNLTGNYTAKKSVLALDPNHLRMPRPEPQDDAIDRLAARRQRTHRVNEKEARRWARKIVASPGYQAAIVDPPPTISGLVRDVSLRSRLRQCLIDSGLNPNNFAANQIKKLVESGRIRQASTVPIRSVVLLRSMDDPVLIDRKRPDYATGRMVRDDHPESKRAYVCGNNHHIEIRVDDRGKWSGQIVTAFEAAQRKLAKLRAFRQAGRPASPSPPNSPSYPRLTATPSRRRSAPSR